MDEVKENVDISVTLKKKRIVAKYPIIENKQHDSATENKKNNAWTTICNEFKTNLKSTPQQHKVRYCIYCWPTFTNLRQHSGA
jgi:flagellar basal body-associated protein FliL